MSQLVRLFHSVAQDTGDMNEEIFCLEKAEENGVIDNWTLRSLRKLCGQMEDLTLQRKQYRE